MRKIIITLMQILGQMVNRISVIEEFNQKSKVKINEMKLKN